MAEKLLFDASSLIYALKLRRLDVLRGSHVQWLTIYEVLNGLWKEASLVKSISAEKAVALARVFGRVLRHMSILSPHGIEEEILRTALEHGVTVYDASYIVLARKNDLILVTEDKKLRNKAAEIITVKSLKEIVEK